LSAIQSHPDLELQLVVAASALLNHGSAVNYIEKMVLPLLRKYLMYWKEKIYRSQNNRDWNFRVIYGFDNLKTRYRRDRCGSI
jgi:hypothetical protein